MLGIFNEYFLALVVIASLVSIVWDGSLFNKADKKKQAKKAKFIGVLYIMVAVVLFVSNKLS